MNYSYHRTSARILPINKTLRATRSEAVAASAFEGRPVVSNQAKEIGKVTHIMMDTSSGQASYVIVSGKNSLGVEHTLHAVPWTSLKFDSVNNRFVLNIDPERMQNAPAFDNDHWPSMINPAWETQIHNYYRQREYWVLPASKKVRAN